MGCGKMTEHRYVIKKINSPHRGYAVISVFGKRRTTLYFAKTKRKASNFIKKHKVKRLAIYTWG
jgi:hypothetical protein